VAVTYWPTMHTAESFQCQTHLIRR
jgi:hypothetical protein